MSTCTVLEPTAIQDTLFGDPKVVDVEANVGPDSPCFCICSCRTGDVKVSNSQLNSAAMSVAAPGQ